MRFRFLLSWLVKRVLDRKLLAGGPGKAERPGTTVRPDNNFPRCRLSPSGLALL
jgi:hypothetical protein